MNLDLQLTDSTELHASSRLDDTGRPFAETRWDVRGALPESAGNRTLWGPSVAMRRLAELILQAARLAEEEAAWQAHTAAAEGSRVA